MSRLTDTEKQKLVHLIERGKPLPPVYKSKLFAPEEGSFVQATKEYRLVYDGKTRREEVIANTPEAPFQLVREFNNANRYPDGWRNMLIYGDNLFALKELYADQRGPNRYGTRDRIKLIYIDPPFSTRQDFMKDKEKAYRDKVLGANFIEFLRKRLVLLREILADDGTIYVHLDWKKGHYIKAILDEIFGEHNFVNEIVWHYFGFKRSTSRNFPRKHDTIFVYGKSAERIWYPVFRVYSKEYLARWKVDENGELYRDDVNPTAGGTRTIYLKDLKGDLVESVWNDIPPVNPVASERSDYPTQKPEQLIERMLKASSDPDTIVLDAFAGSGTTLAVAEKLGMRWVGMDCSKLAIYTTQKRMLDLTNRIGPGTADHRLEHDRVNDFEEILKSSPGLLIVTDKARKGECNITLELLEDIAEIIKKYDLAKKSTPFSLVCPEEKLKIPKSRLQEVKADGEAGQKRIKVKGVDFRLSFVESRQKPEKEKPLRPKAFALYNAGIYDNEAIKQMPWMEYRPFVLKLFQVREHEHFIKGFRCDGYLGVNSVYVWNYPDHKKLTLDYDYVKSLHEILGGSVGEKFYVIAPIVSMGFAEDEYSVGKTTYVFLKVPISILMRLLRSGEHGALKQPTKEADVNEVIDAVGFDFLSQPEVEVKCKKERAPDGPLLKQYVIHLKEFRSKTLATDPEDFSNFETFSMAMVDTDYDGETFKLSHVFWADNLIEEEHKRLKAGRKGRKAKDEETSENLQGCEQLSLRIAEEEFRGKQLMVIFCDRYGNEKVLKLQKTDFQ